MKKNLPDLAALVLRIGFGLGLALLHGWGKVLRIADGNYAFSDPIGIGSTPSLFLAAGAEFGCAMLVVLGLLTRWTAIPPIATMAVAFFIAHGGDPLARRELALVYLIAFVAIAILGSGRYSLDALLFGRKRR